MNKEKQIIVDKTGKLQGRGAYVCYNEECLNKLIKTKRLERVFETTIENEVYQNMRGVMIDKSN